MHVKRVQRRRCFIAELCHHKPFPVFGPWHAAIAVSRCRNRLMRHSSRADSPRRPCMIFQRLTHISQLILKAHLCIGLKQSVSALIQTFDAWIQISCTRQCSNIAPCHRSPACWMRETTKVMGETRVTICVSAGLIQGFVPLASDDSLREPRKAATS